MIIFILMLQTIALPSIGRNVHVIFVSGRYLAMGDIRLNLRTAVTVGLVGFLGVWVINRALGYAGMTTWQA